MLNITQKQKKRVLTLVLTSLIILTLLVAGPSEAAIFSIYSPENIEQGKEAEMILTIKLENEPLEFDSFFLEIKGKENGNKDSNITCKFSYLGELIGDCPWVIVTLNGNVTDYEYGYGYNINKKVSYIIKIQTANLTTGKYSYNIQVLSGEDKIKEVKGDFQIFLTKKTLEGCSIRAKTTEEKISFYIPKRNANLGEGSFTRDRTLGILSYDFKVKGALEDNKNITVFLIEGYKKERGIKTNLEDARLIINKTSNQLKIIDGFSSSWNNITFKNNCGF